MYKSPLFMQQTCSMCSISKNSIQYPKTQSHHSIIKHTKSIVSLPKKPFKFKEN